MRSIAAAIARAKLSVGIEARTRAGVRLGVGDCHRRGFPPAEPPLCVPPVQILAASGARHRCLSTSSRSWAAWIDEAAPKRSTVEIGTSYENLSRDVLSSLFPGMTLDRVGGAHDGGIDLRGWWLVPPPVSSEPSTEPIRIRVIVQCKAESKKSGPVHLRELHGAYTAQPRAAAAAAAAAAGEKAAGAQVGVLVSKAGFSKQATIVATAASIPMILVHLSELGEPVSILCNEALTQLLDARIEVRLHRSSSSERPVVYLDGRRL